MKDMGLEPDLSSNSYSIIYQLYDFVQVTFWIFCMRETIPSISQGLFGELKISSICHLVIHDRNYNHPLFLQIALSSG